MRLRRIRLGMIRAIFWALVGLLGLEIGVRLLVTFPSAEPAYRTDALVSEPYAPALFKAIEQGDLSHRFEPFVHYRLQPYSDPNIRVGADGFRMTPGTVTSTDATRVWLFGGSTMWGMGARDEGTIAGHLARHFGDTQALAIRNFGQIGYMSTQEVVTLLTQLQAGERPHVVVFYDGVNEVLPALKLGRVGIPLDVPRRELEFNLTRPEATGRIVRQALRNLVRQSALIRWVRSSPARPPASTIAVSSVDPTAEAVVQTYATNVAAVEALARQFDFTALFFWQPTVYTKARHSPDETKAAERTAAFKPLYDATRRRLAQRRLPGVIDLSDVFEDDPAPVFFDFCHLSELGNRRVAEAMAPHIEAAIDRRSR